MTRPRLTVRARLTLLYTGLFTLCGAISVAVSYTLVAQLRAQGQGNGPPPPALGRGQREHVPRDGASCSAGGGRHSE